MNANYEIISEDMSDRIWTGSQAGLKNNISPRVYENNLSSKATALRNFIMVF